MKQKLFNNSWILQNGFEIEARKLCREEDEEDGGGEREESVSLECDK